MVSVCLNVVPRSFMYRLARRSFTKRDENVRKQQCQRWCKDMAFWTVSFAFSAFHLLLITAFLANLGPGPKLPRSPRHPPYHFAAQIAFAFRRSMALPAPNSHGLLGPKPPVKSMMLA
eukprot:g16600.t1